MPTESGDKKLLGNFRKLIDEVSADPNYNPANTKLKKSALEAQYDAGDASASAVSAARAPNKLAITDRETAFSGLRAMAVRSRNFLKASGAPKPVTAGNIWSRSSWRSPQSASRRTRTRWLWP